jgi:hypothetical protein
MTGNVGTALQRVRHLSWIVTVLLIAGCVVGYSNDRVSQPTTVGQKLPTKRVTYVGDMFVSGDVAFQISPYNTTGKDFMVLPYPHRFADPPPANAPFQAAVYLKINKPGYTIALHGIRYWTDPTKPVQASKVLGPFACDTSQQPRTYEQIAAIPVPLPANACTAMWLEFNTDTPDPAQTFFFAISALSVNGEKVTLPVIRFEQAKRTHSVVLP